MKSYVLPVLLALTGVLLITNSLTDAGVPDVDVVLTEDNLVSIIGPINNGTIRQAQIKLAELNVTRGDRNYPIYIVLDTPGGSISSGIAFIEFTKGFTNLKTLTLNAASMGAMIVQAVNGERLATGVATLMFHRPTLQLGGQISEGEFESRLKYIKEIVKKVTVQIAARMNLSYDAYQALVKDELWLYGDQLLEMSAIDRVVTVRCDKDLVKTKILTKLKSIFGEIEFESSACPLIISE